MRIALVVHKFPPVSLGGTEIYTQSLADGLAQLGHDVFVFYRDDGAGRGFVEEWQDRGAFRAWRVGLPFDASRASPLATFLSTFFNPPVEKSYERFLSEVKPDLVHFQHLMLLSYRLLSQTQRKSIPTLLTFHDYWFVCANAQLIRYDGAVCESKGLGLHCARAAVMRAGGGIRSLTLPGVWMLLQIRDRLVRRAALEIERWIAPSQFLIKQYVSRGFPASRFTILENGIAAERIRAFPRVEAEEGNAIRLSYIGSLAWQKGVHVLIDAVRHFSKDELLLKVYGDPLTFPDYSAQLQAVANPNNTFFKGRMPNARIGEALATSDLVAVPSLWYENSPVVIQEAFAAGVPVIASRIGALCEKVQDGIDGILVAPGSVIAWREALRRVVKAPEKLTDLKQGVHQPLTVKQHTEGMEDLYRNAR